MRPCVIAANWKMHLDSSGAQALARDVRQHMEREPANAAQVILCPPFPFLGIVKTAIEGSGIGLGAQNMHTAPSGAFTGEVAAPMLQAMGCGWVILGHSERRQYFGEDDAHINAKVHTAVQHGLTPIVCVGETLEQRELGVTEQVIEAQVRGVLAGLAPDNVAKLILAYEPVWAIGTGKTATPAQAQEVHALIRALVGLLHGSTAADALVIQYGGSVKADNAAELFAQADVDGGLVGGASLDASAFAAIIHAAGATL
ncbi:MAG: triose-phosphate isomerase [Bacteroidia bacterium]|nr:triose-phosphate isomerase [Bacteroidia bacterium]